MNVILYSTGCPKCKILKKKLADAQIDYSVIEDVDVMVSKGLKDVPWLEVDGNLMNFADSSKWINERV